MSILIYFFIAVAISIVTVVISVFMFGSYKHKCELIYVTNDNTKKFVVVSRWKDAKQKDAKGNDLIKIEKLKDFYYPKPNHQSIDMTEKGRFFFRAFVNEVDEIDYIKGSNNYNFYQTLNTNQRQILINQIKKANSKKGFNWNEHMGTIVNGMVMVIILGMAFMFWEDITKPSVEVARINARSSEVINENLKIIKELDQGIQSIGNDLSYIKNRVDYNEPPN